ncbi:MAG: thermonuclease family protein [gamma proteobacterium endosymbiont of Lamellibrachia anaximandri]|nr:thermonuclease family protein [gamma proteobacterium endosymbiont of Lamellibrachia anaximandri]MBL3618097.1 thermonuclease family protein [gamma proteobacterium endosymbiont of Lamellibrachia anaximandri]
MIKKRIEALVLSALLLMLSLPIQSATLVGRVFAVQNSNQITVSTDDGKFRNVILMGVAVPDRGSSAGRNTKRQLHSLLAGQVVTIEYRTLNPLGVIIGTVYRGGADMNLRLIQSGLARAKSEKGLNREMLNHYRTAEQQARQRRLGLWQR